MELWLWTKQSRQNHMSFLYSLDKTGKFESAEKFDLLSLAWSEQIVFCTIDWMINNFS